MQDEGEEAVAQEMPAPADTGTPILVDAMPTAEPDAAPNDVAAGAASGTVESPELTEPVPPTVPYFRLYLPPTCITLPTTPGTGTGNIHSDPVPGPCGQKWRLFMRGSDQHFDTFIEKVGGEGFVRVCQGGFA